MKKIFKEMLEILKKGIQDDVVVNSGDVYEILAVTVGKGKDEVEYIMDYNGGKDVREGQGAVWAELLEQIEKVKEEKVKEVEKEEVSQIDEHMEVVADREPIEVLEEDNGGGIEIWPTKNGVIVGLTREKDMQTDEPIEEDEKVEVSEVNETGADREPIGDVKNKIIKIRNKGEKVWKGWIERLRY